MKKGDYALVLNDCERPVNVGRIVRATLHHSGSGFVCRPADGRGPFDTTSGGRAARRVFFADELQQLDINVAKLLGGE